MICLDLMSYSVVENKGFHKLLNVVAPQYQLLSHWHLSHTLLRCESKRSYLKNWREICALHVWHLAKQIFHKCISFSHWPLDRMQTEPIRNRWIVTALLKMQILNEDHTAANILHHLQAVVKQLQDDVGAKFSAEYFVTDNVTNIVKAMADGNYVHIRCISGNSCSKRVSGSDCSQDHWVCTQIKQSCEQTSQNPGRAWPSQECNVTPSMGTSAGHCENTTTIWGGNTHCKWGCVTCPPTSVSSERIFSTAGDIMSPHPSRLIPSHVEELVLTKYNMEKCNWYIVFQVKYS